MGRLRAEIEALGHCVDILSLPFRALPTESIAEAISQWREIDLRYYSGRPIDMVIATRFPSYVVSHPNKITWLIHQHRQAYELYGTRFGDLKPTSAADETLRRFILDADHRALREAQRIYTISQNVSSRLDRYLGLPSKVLEAPPPLLGSCYSGKFEDFILCVVRLCSIKRVDLLIRAMPSVDDGLKLKIVGLADESSIENYLKSEVDKHHLWHRVEFLGEIDTTTLLSLYSRAFAVFFAAYDEDHGFVSLEALASSRPVLTTLDSGGILQYVEDGKNGLVLEPTEAKVAEGINKLWKDRDLHENLASGAGELPELPSWPQVARELCSAI